MAFGKDTSILNKIASKGTYGGGGSFGQRVNAAQQSRGGGGVGKRRGPPPFITQFRPTLGTVPDTIRVLLGNYANEVYNRNLDVDDHPSAGFSLREDPFLIMADHYHAGLRRGGICSGGEAWFNPKRARPCAGCEINREDRARRRDEGTEDDENEERLINRSRKFVFSIFDFGRYHEVPAMMDGVERINQRTGKPYTNWEKCGRVGCLHCRERRLTKEGHLTHWPLNNTQMRIVMHAHGVANRHCKLCRATNSIQSRSWMCPGCQNDIIDVATTEMSAEDVDKLALEAYSCGCGFNGFLVETVACSSCLEEGFAADAPGGMEGTPQNMRATLFDVNIDVSLVPGPEGSNNKVLQVSNVSAPVEIPEQFVKLAKPMDLYNLYQPDEYKTQCERFEWNYIAPPQVPPAHDPVRVYMEAKIREERAKGYSR